MSADNSYLSDTPLTPMHRVQSRTVLTTTYGDKKVGPKPQVTEIGVDIQNRTLVARVSTAHQIHAVGVRLAPQDGGTGEISVLVDIYEDGGKYGKYSLTLDIRALVHAVLADSGLVHPETE